MKEIEKEGRRWMTTEVLVLNEARNVTLTAYIQPVGGAFSYITKRPAILILPGGGYAYCSDREADPVAMLYLKAGYQVFILRYSVNEHRMWPNPLEDYEQAMRLIRANAEVWNLYADKVAVIGFSAGGHLAACAATMAKEKPNAALLGYAVTKGDMARSCIENAPDAVQAVDKDTCPCFLFATRNDDVVPIVNSIEFAQKLAVNGISFESHIYAYGPHGFSSCDTSVQNPSAQICSRVPQWSADSLAWLKDVFGEFADGKMTEPVCKKHINGNYEPTLYLGCTLGYLWTKEEAKPLMEPLAEWLTVHREEVAAAIGPAVLEKTKSQGVMGLLLSIASRTMKDICGYAGFTEEEVQRLDEALRKIPN